MAMNGLLNLAEVLETGKNEILVDPAIIRRAVLPIRRMLDSRNRSTCRRAASATRDYRTGGLEGQFLIMPSRGDISSWRPKGYQAVVT